MKKTIMSLVSLLVIGTSTGFCKTNVSVKNFNGNQPRTEQVVKTNKDTKTSCKGLKPITPETKKVTEQVKKQEPKKCTCKECQKKNQKKQVTKFSKVNPQKHVQVRK